MAKSAEYEKVKQSADKKYTELMSLPSEATKDEIIEKYEAWLTKCEKPLLYDNHYSIKSIDDLDEFAGEGLECIEKMDKAHEAYPQYLPEQSILAIKIYKEADKYVDTLSRENSLPVLQRNREKLLTIDELRAIRKWCLQIQLAAEKKIEREQEIKKRGRGVLEKQVYELLERIEWPPNVTALELKKILDIENTGKYKPTSVDSIRDTGAWRKLKKA